MKLKVREIFNTKHIQAVVVTVMSAPVFGFYVSPQTTIHLFKSFLDQVNRWFQGPGVLIGDINSRDTSWNTTKNRRGPTLRKWAVRHGFTTQRPDRPTMWSKNGHSRVDLISHRSRIAPNIGVGELTDLSDHAPKSTSLRRNINSIMMQIGDELNNGDVAHQQRTVARALQLSSKLRPLICPALNPDKFTNFMAILQPAETTEPVSIKRSRSRQLSQTRH